MSSSDYNASGNPSVAQNLFIRFFKEVRGGGDEAFEQLCEQHPDQAEYLRELHSAYQLGAALSTSQSFQESIRDRCGEVHEVTLSVEDDSSINVSDDEASTKPGTMDSSRYLFEGEIARGGMGIVFRVQDKDLSRRIAMKVMLNAEKQPKVANQSDSLAFARFLEEAQVMAQLDHPGIVPVHEVGFDADGQLYFTMKLVKGRNFNQICSLVKEEKEGWNTTRAIGVLVRVCQAVAFAHLKGVIHRDLKPSNIMVGRFGEAYVMDWGLAKVEGCKDLHDIRVQPDHEATLTTVHSVRRPTTNDPEQALLTVDGSVLGTPAYMPPEQAGGQIDQVDELSDVYSLGAVLYKLLTGTAPYLKEGAVLSPHTILGLVVQGPPQSLEQSNSNTSAELAAICNKAMAREKEDRYESCNQLAEDLQAFLDRRVVKAYRTGAFAELKAWVTRNPAIAAMATALVIVSIGSTLFSVRKARQEQSISNLLRKNLYVAEMNFAYDNWNNGNLSVVRDVLEKQNPAQTKNDLRGFEWHLLSALYLENQAKNIETFEAVAMHPNGTLAAKTGRSVFLVDLETGHKSPIPMEVTPPNGTRYCRLTFDASGRFMAITWALESKSVIEIFDLEEKSSYRVVINTQVNCVAFSSSGELWAYGDSGGDICMLRTESGEVTRKSKYEKGFSCNQLAFSPDDRYLAYVSQHCRDLVLWHVLPSEDQSSPLVYSVGGGLRSVAWSSSGRQIAVGGRSLTVLSFDGGDQQMRNMPSDAADWISCIAFSPDDTRLAYGTVLHRVEVRDIQTFESVFRGYHSRDVQDVSFVSDGKLLSNSGTELKIWEFDHTDSKSYRGDGSAWNDTGGLQLEDGSIAIADGNHIAIWDPQTNRRTKPMKHEKKAGRGITDLAYAPATNLLASCADESQEIRIWNASDFKQQAPLDDPEFDAYSTTLAFSPDGRLLAAGGPNYAGLWDVTKNEVIWRDATLDERDWCNASGFSVHGDYLVTAGGKWETSGYVRVWDLASSLAEPLSEFSLSNMATTLDVSKDNMLAVGDMGGVITLFDLDTMSAETELHGHASAVATVKFHPDGRRLLSGGWDRLIKTWDVSTSSACGSIRDLYNVAALRFVHDPQNNLGLLVITKNDGDYARIHWTTNADGLFKTIPR